MGGGLPDAFKLDLVPPAAAAAAPRLKCITTFTELFHPKRM
jgi:hypothetical protein